MIVIYLMIEFLWNLCKKILSCVKGANRVMNKEYINAMVKAQKSIAQRRLMVRIAKMYYYDNMSQQAIADVLEISRSNVSRLLRMSREMDIVDIRINDASLKSIEISEKLNIVHQTVSKRRRATLKELRKYLVKEGFEWPDE